MEPDNLHFNKFPDDAVLLAQRATLEDCCQGYLAFLSWGTIVYWLHRGHLSTFFLILINTQQTNTASFNYQMLRFSLLQK